MAARRSSSKGRSGGRAKAAEVAVEDVEETEEGGGMTLQDGMQIATFLALLGAIGIMIFQLLPRYAEGA